MKFVPIEIFPQIKALNGCRSLVVAYSGGLDSSVLLHALTELRNRGHLQQPIRALHVNHGLNPGAESWQLFCEQTCQRLAIEIQCLQVEVAENSGRSLEELARDARYQALREQLRSGDCLLMGHHQDDEMENLLLRLTRGSGPGGLAGIPRKRLLGEAMLLRPLLDYQRESLLRYAEQHGLEWIEDDSNTDTDFDRNFWRHDILPTIERRFPGFRDSWSKSMNLCGEADQLQQELAAGDLVTLATDDPGVLNIEPLLGFSEPRQRNVLRYWMQNLGFQPPGWQFMQRLTNEVLVSAKPGACLECQAGSVQRFGNQLVLLRAGSLFSRSTQEWTWRPESEHTLNLDDNGKLDASFSIIAEPGRNQYRLKVEFKELVVRYRQEGECGRLAGRRSRPLKKIIQDSTLPPWLRSRQPLIFCKGELVCIPGIGICEGYTAEPNQPGLEVTWQPPELLY